MQEANKIEGIGSDKRVGRGIRPPWWGNAAPAEDSAVTGMRRRSGIRHADDLAGYPHLSRAAGGTVTGSL